MTVTKTYVLVDLQNRKPPFEHVEACIGETGEAWIFYGEQELELLPNYWQIGKQVSIVPISQPGNNSLDFHLVLYLGYLVAKDKKARFIVVAADRDYDPAIAHARGAGINVVRVPELRAEVPTDGQAPALATDSPGGLRASKTTERTPTRVDAAGRDAPDRLPNAKRIAAVYEGILKDIRGGNKPRTLEALKARIRSRLGKAATPEGVADVLAQLKTTDVILLVDGKEG
ncbi:MAG: hypothetical protein K8R60_06030 [Burkholderiales bacterium]|nr:hypothetical protein [Burkholderiales bacterium]